MADDTKITDLREHARKTGDKKLERFVAAMDDMVEQMKIAGFPDHHIDQMIGVCAYMFIERNKL